MARNAKSTTARNLYLDIALTAGFVASLKPFVTGIPIHEWLGLAVGAGLLIHGLLHRQWIAAITARLSSRLPLRTRACYTLDALLMASFATLIVTGLLISEAVLPALGVSVVPSLFVIQLHNVSAWTALGALGLKLALHASWIANAIRCHILRRAPNAARRAPRCPEDTVAGRRALYSRREFLTACGMGLGSVALLALWRNWTPPVAQAQAATVLADEPVAAMADSASAETPEDSVQELDDNLGPDEDIVDGQLVDDDVAGGADAVERAASATGAVTPVPTATTAVTIEPLPTATAVQIVRTRCPYGLVNDPYPGRCRRYIDSNGNGYCDLSQSA